MARTKHAATRKVKPQPKKKLQFERSPGRTAAPPSPQSGGGSASASANPGRAARTEAGAPAEGTSGQQQQQQRKPRRFRAGTLALREIRKFQKSIELLITFVPFTRLVREITSFYSQDVTRWTPQALIALQEAAEYHLVDLYEAANLCASMQRVLPSANAASGVAVSEECKARFQELRTARAHRFVVFKVDDAAQQVVVDKVGPRDATFDDLTASLPADGCRYAVYDHDFTVGDATAAGEAPRSKIFFIAWSPATADVRSKMVYASSNEGFKKELDGVHIDVQATEPSELTIDVLREHAS